MSNKMYGLLLALKNITTICNDKAYVKVPYNITNYIYDSVNIMMYVHNKQATRR